MVTSLQYLRGLRIMKTKDKEYSQTPAIRKATPKNPRKKSRSAMSAPARNARRTQNRRLPGRRTSEGRSSDGVIFEQGIGTEDGPVKGEYLMRSAFYREETGSSDGLYEYVL